MVLREIEKSGIKVKRETCMAYRRRFEGGVLRG
jgi:hypothetical protein